MMTLQRCGAHNWVKRAIFLSFTFTMLLGGVSKYLMESLADDCEKTDQRVEKMDDKIDAIKNLVTEINTKLAFLIKERG